MTQISAAIMAVLERRGIDPELAVKLGLESERGQGGGERLVIPFVRSDKVVRRKYRRFDLPDDQPGRWVQDKGGVRCAWNEDCLRDETLLNEPLVITEGEFDAMAVIQSGHHRVISVPDGAPPPGDRSSEDLAESRKYEWLRDIGDLLSMSRCPQIIIASDGDQNGAALLQDLAIQLGRARCKFVTYPKAADVFERGRDRLKDLNEVLEDYGVAGVQQCLRQASFLKVDGVFRMSELPPEAPRTCWQIGFDLLGQNIKNLRTGDTTVVTGIPSFGKSTFVNDLVCRVVRRYGVNVAWASFEQNPQDDHKRSLRTWFLERHVSDCTPAEIAEADAWIDARHRFLKPKEDEETDLEWMLDRMEAAVIQHDCKIIVIDPWNEMDHSKRNGESTTEYVGRALRHLNRFRRAFGVHLIIVAHPTKSVKDPTTGEYRIPTLYDISDSAMFNNKADLGIIVHRSGREGNTTIKVAKSRYHDLIGPPGTVIMAYAHSDRRFRELERMS